MQSATNANTVSAMNGKAILMSCHSSI